MTNTTRYTDRTEAIEREIIVPIEAGDVDAIADEVLGDYEQGYACMVDPERFWEIVAAHELTD